MVEIFLCDDDSNITDYLKFFIAKNFENKMHPIAFNSVTDMLNMIQIGEVVPDILVMDINLSDGNGIEAVKSIQAEHNHIKVIYLTGVLRYATEIFQTVPSYFLVKPINENKLLDALEKTLGEVERDSSDAVVIKTNGSEVLVYRKEIMYVESQGRKLLLYLHAGQQMSVYEKMDVMQEKLGTTFVRCHKSFLVNMKYITDRVNQEFHLSDGTVLPISKPNLKEAKLKFISYLGEYV